MPSTVYRGRISASVNSVLQIVGKDGTDRHASRAEMKKAVIIAAWKTKPTLIANWYHRGDETPAKRL